MPANIESFASFRQPAWHDLGVVFDHEVNTQEMLDLANLSGWNIRKVALNTTGRFHKDLMEVVRDNPFDGKTDTLGIVSSKYRVFSNEELFNFGDNLLHGGGRWETAGSLGHGERVFGSLAIPGQIVLDPNGRGDVINEYLLLSSSHDGTWKLRASITPVRVVCQNTLTLALGSTKQSFAISHCSTMDQKVQVARETLGLASAYFDKFDEMAQKMIQAEIDNAKAAEILEAAFPRPENDVKGSVTKWDNKMNTLWGIYNGPTCDNIHGTLWGIYNAMEEAIDWHRTSRTGDHDNILEGASGFDEVVNKEKNRILQKVMTFV